uniref:Cytochrome b561 domain-containing protein n=1 Tax=Haptolina brevifila TaxID=156173 RepID=A0A7S2GAU1_9EUKA|mmetsp:Transcript_30197/g.60609  ORF Transcript_30197/g.60609 Transcript_30197/m.60609 type:complete len:251 (+) Transcript_30197:1349-2101(+)
MYNGPPAGGHLLTQQVQLNSGSADKVCGCTGGAGNSGPVGNSAPTTGFDYEQGVSMLEVHAWLMLIAWGLLLPLGAVVPRFWSRLIGKKWVYVHMGVQLSGLGLVVGGFYCSIAGINALQSTHFDTAANGHKIIGLVMVIISLLQLSAFARPHKPADGEQQGKARTLWSWSHRLSGMLVIALSIANAVTGTDRIGSYTSTFAQGYAIYFGMLGFAAAIGVLGFLLGRLLKKGKAKEKVSPPVAPLQSSSF